MKRFILFLCLIISISFVKAQLSQEKILQYKNEYQQDSFAFQSKFRVLSFEEFINLHEAPMHAKAIQETQPPFSPIRAIAEWEPNQGVIIRGHTSGGQGRFHIPFSVIADMSQHVIVYVTCTNAQQSQINTTLTNNGVNMTNVEYINVTTDSQWTRDYTPHFVEYGEDNEIGLMNFEYDRPRPNDNNFYSALGPHLGKTTFSMPMRHTGGNYMVDGFTSAVSTDHIYYDNWDELGLSPQEVDDMFEEYLGVSNYYLVYDALDLYIKHIDCWAKLLAPDKILILDVPESDIRHADFDAAANFWANETSPYGTNYQVFRVFTQPGTDEAYVNSLIMNDRVYVPIKGGASSARDAAAIAVYEAAMPGYNIVGVINDTGSTGWYDTDALHCRTYQVPDMNTVRITHFPYLEDVEIQESYIFNADIVSLGGGHITDAIINYRINEGSWETATMSHVEDNIYEVTIDIFQIDDEVEYYIEASNNLSKTEFHPYIGEPDPHRFNIICPIINLGEDIEQCGGVVILDAGEGFLTYLWNGNPGNQTFSVTETGTYNIEVTDNFGCTIIAEINVSLIPGSPIVTDDFLCGSGNLTLTATGNGNIYWYEEEVGGTQIHSGNQYTAFFDLTTSFFIETIMDYAISYYVGNTNSITNGGNHTNNGFYLEFTAFEEFNLASIEVNANGAGNRIIELRDSENNILEQVTRNIPHGESRVDVEFNITPGDYQLRCGTANPSLFRSNTGVSYPYTISDVVSITGSNAGENFYYYFYNWEVKILEECVSERVEVTAYVYPELEINLESTPESAAGAEDGTATVNISNGTPNYTFAWSNGGNTQTITNLEGGIYSVTVQDLNNCEAITSVEVITNAALVPIVIFEASNNSGCEELAVQFTDMSLNNPISWEWNFGDGNTSDAQHPIHTYISPGTYTVSLQATNSDGVGFLEIADYIFVGENPVLNVSADGPFCEGNDIQFNTNSSYGGDEYEWTGPGNFNSNNANPIIENAITEYSGDYTVTLTNSISNCFITETISIEINENPQINLDDSFQQCGGTIILDAGEGFETYTWNGEEGEQTLSVETSGTYTLIVADINSCTANAQIEVTIHDIPVIIMEDEYVQCGGTIILDAGEGFETYTWNGEQGEQTLSVAATGTYILIVEDFNGCTASKETNITIHPVAELLTSATDESEPDANDGTATVSVAGGTPDYLIEWSNGLNTFTITNLAGDTYFVTVIDANNCETYASVTVNTLTPEPLADFEADITLGCDNLNVQFSDMSINNPENWHWDFGDNNYSVEQNPMHQYNVAGTYTVSLSVSNQYGSDFKEIIDYIKIGETPNFAVNTTPASGENIPDGSAWIEIFSGIPPYQINWSNGQTGTEITDVLPGMYSVIVRDNYNCFATQPVIIQWISNVEQSVQSLGIFPNPASEYIYISASNIDNAKIILLDISGKTILSFYPDKITTGIDISGLSPGMYFIRLENENVLLIEKLIIK